ncbi:MAG TPA: ABC transporter ATP-binding protein [Chitinophagaceae bacterium]|nr:MAG: multidrug ABC transporter ATPase [Bacteroidetes bacterium OLB11]HMN32358.1 ABC transporter ATP-binding protein [Chitinophagaceae bacterium]
MNLLTKKVDEAINYFEWKNENTGFRVLTDAALDTSDLSIYKKCIELADWRAKNPENNIQYSAKAKELANTICKIDFKQKPNNQLLFSAENISKEYKNNQFKLGPVSLEIMEGQLIGLVGENGNGKTTLLRMLAQDLAISGGKIRYHFTQPNQDLYALRTKLTYIPQRTPKWYGSVKENLKLTATHYGVSPNENEYIVLMWMIRFGLWNYRNYQWSKLSSGYKMRFELARTFLRNPKVLFLDEPLANLDILSQQLIIEDLKFLGKSLVNPLGIVLSSQQLYEVEKVSDDIIFLKEGLPSSFNKMKTEANTQNQNLIIEMEIENSRDELMSALEGVNCQQLKFSGNNYYIEMLDITVDDFLHLLLDKKIRIKYFRDISVSTRRFFNQ